MITLWWCCSSSLLSCCSCSPVPWEKKTGPSTVTWCAEKSPSSTFYSNCICRVELALTWTFILEQVFGGFLEHNWNLLNGTFLLWFQDESIEGSSHSNISQCKDTHTQRGLSLDKWNVPLHSIVVYFQKEKLPSPHSKPKRKWPSDWISRFCPLIVSLPLSPSITTGIVLKKVSHFKFYSN